MKFNDINTAINSFVESAIKQGKYSEEGNYKKGNYEYKKIDDAYHFLKNNDMIDLLLPLLDNCDISVKLWASTYLINYFKKESEKALRDIVLLEIPHYSFSAKIILEENF